MGIERLEPFIGEWKLEAQIPGAEDVRARAVFEWILGGTFLQERSEVDHPAAPNGVCIISANADDGGGGFTQHYFDDRGVVRVYEMTFEDGRWELLRVKPDFTPLDFSQRYTGRLSDDGSRIDGRWETSNDGQSWDLDFQLNYLKLA
jgi:hypothetical protein